MLGLFGTLNLGARSLQTQQAGVEVAGQNLSNINNPAYARQRLLVQTSITIPTQLGPEGTGVQMVAIQQLRDLLLDAQIQGESSVGGYWNANKRLWRTRKHSSANSSTRPASSIDNTATAGSAFRPPKTIPKAWPRPLASRPRPSISINTSRISGRWIQNT